MANHKDTVTYIDARFRLLAALLLQHREMSLSEIEALPFVKDRDAAERLADELMKRLGAVRSQRRLAHSDSVPRWEDVLHLPDEVTAK